MMHLYGALLCIVVHPKRFTIMGGVSPQPPPVCSIHMDDATAATGHRGYNPTLYEKCHGFFNDHRESGPRFNVSSERRSFFTV